MWEGARAFPSVRWHFRNILCVIAARRTSAFGQSTPNRCRIPQVSVIQAPAEFDFRTRDWCLGVHVLLPRMVEERREFPQWYTQSPLGADVAC